MSNQRFCQRLESHVQIEHCSDKVDNFLVTLQAVENNPPASLGKNVYQTLCSTTVGVNHFSDLIHFECPLTHLLEGSVRLLAYDDAVLFNKPWYDHFAQLPAVSIHSLCTSLN